MIEDVNETGSYYITKEKIFRKFNNRFGKKISYYNSDFLSMLEIDTMSDFNLIKELFKTSLLKKT